MKQGAKRQISLRSTGNLGNQMFQYTAARWISRQMGDVPIVTELGGEFHTDWLADFEAPHILCEKSRRNPLQWLLRSAMHLVRYAILKQDVAKIQHLQRRLQPLLNFFGVYYYSYGYYAFHKAHSKNIVAEGYFETPKYADAIRETVLRDFTPRHAPLPENAVLYAAIAQTNAVCVTVRRGDFITGDNNADTADCNVCTVEYFERAAAYCREHLQTPVFFVFSDDIDWAKENLRLGGETHYERGTDPVWEKLRLMYSCKHFIISNSTFSWWAQYLSRNVTDKLVVAPDRWRNHSLNVEIYQAQWHLLSPDVQ